MVTFRGGRVTGSALLLALAVLVAGCGREQQDWHAAESAGTSEAFGAFIEQHPQSELVSQARARIARFAEDRDWQQASGAATLTAYQKFLARHPTGHWSEAARIGIEGFSLGSAPRTAGAPAGATPLHGATGVRLLQLAAAGAAAHETQAPAAASSPADAASAPSATAQTAATLRRAVAAETSRASTTGAISSARLASYSVQLGAFGSEASAGAEWGRLQTRFGAQLHGLEPRIVAASTPAGRLYRLQVPTDDEAQARAICAALKQQWQACVAVPPQ